MKKRLCAMGCAILLLLGLLLPAGEAAGTVYLLAVNNKFCDFPNGALPEVKDNAVYIPYTTFDRMATEVDLGVYYGINITMDGHTVLSLYSSRKWLTFTVDMGVCADGDGNDMSFRAVFRNQIPYVPAAEVCDFFGLTYSLIPTADRGTLVRICDRTSAPMTDRAFMTASVRAMSNRYEQVLQRRGEAVAATPAPTVTRAPSVGENGPKTEVRLYLAVDASTSEGDLAEAFPDGMYGLFLFTPESLTQRASQVRKAVAAGHSVGLIVEGTEEEARAELERGNELLTHIARIRTHIVSAPDELSASLAGQGWTCWRPDVTGSTATSILSGLNIRSGVRRVELPPVVSVAGRVCSDIRRDGYTLLQPLETNL